ncbi:hypothetical protein HOY34_08230 [Xinfangfangia sp. D13-10-4-6]|uniref:hypothetical protein n=1 Tax=Pseudogemmobacter hezensis TaxID=2737662 RepID=UPI0015564107|nr:hypothetical protein [Pseudogemmobacter hezensis]NPD15186.1 hypothetical protein [Pseudogemmobacter hezensis]
MKRALISGVTLSAVLALAACAPAPRMAVPTKPGESFLSARSAIGSCAHTAPQGGKDAVGFSYIGNIVYNGGLVGMIGTAMTEDDIRARGEAGAVDKCLKKQGFKRRHLTEAEERAVNSAPPAQRTALLDHLVGGGTLETFPTRQIPY